MKKYSFFQEFTGNCAAGLPGVESLATKPKSLITSKPFESLFKVKPKKAKTNAVKKCDTRVKSLVR